MNCDEYEERIATMLCRDDIVRAGTAAALAARCILVASEAGCSGAVDAVEQLESLAGIAIDEQGKYFFMGGLDSAARKE